MLLSPSLTLSVNWEAELYSGVHSFTSVAVCREVADVPHSGWLERLLIYPWNKSHSLGEGRKKTPAIPAHREPSFRLMLLMHGWLWTQRGRSVSGPGLLVLCWGRLAQHSLQSWLHGSALNGKQKWDCLSVGVRWAKSTCKDSYVCDTACIMAKCWGVGAITEWGWQEFR